MGLGKTIQTISLIAFLRESKGLLRPYLIVAPKSTLGNWIKEFRCAKINFINRKWLPTCSVVKLIAAQDEREEILKNYIKTEDFDVCITTFEGVLKCSSALRKIKFKYLVVDEAHKLKNDESLNHSTLKSLHTDHKLFLTGTPLQNNPHELWALLSFLMP